jgi:dihydrofolate reductase
MRTLKYYVACSIDGFIAHEDGSFDGFAPDGEPVTDYLQSLKTYGAVLMGRKTYEVGLNMDVTDPYPHLESYVFSRTMTKSPNESVHLVSDNMEARVRDLKATEGGAIYLCGGATLAGTLFAEGLIDEIILKVNPFVMGKGIPLFTGSIKQTQLELKKSTVYENGCVWLYYRVKA